MRAGGDLVRLLTRSIQNREVNEPGAVRVDRAPMRQLDIIKALQPVKCIAQRDIVRRRKSRVTLRTRVCACERANIRGLSSASDKSTHGTAARCCHSFAD